jgi:hypothetical protein
VFAVLEGFADFCHWIILFDFRERGHMPRFDVLRFAAVKNDAAPKRREGV